MRHECRKKNVNMKKREEVNFAGLDSFGWSASRWARQPTPPMLVPSAPANTAVVKWYCSLLVLRNVCEWPTNGCCCCLKS